MSGAWSLLAGFTCGAAMVLAVIALIGGMAWASSLTGYKSPWDFPPEFFLGGIIGGSVAFYCIAQLAIRKFNI